jgi:hypothetical protein
MKKVLLLVALSVGMIGAATVEEQHDRLATVREELNSYDAAERYAAIAQQLILPDAVLQDIDARIKLLGWLEDVSTVLGNDSLDEDDAAKQLAALDKKQPSLGASRATWIKRAIITAAVLVALYKWVKWYRESLPHPVKSKEDWQKGYAMMDGYGTVDGKVVRCVQKLGNPDLV